MNEEVINDLYSNAVSKGYKKSREEFVSLLNSNSNVLNDMYSYVQSKGYGKGIDEFKSLIGGPVKVVEETIEPVKKKDTVSPFVDGGSELTKFDPRTGQVVQETPAFAQNQPEVKLPEQKLPERTEFQYQPGKPLPKQIPSVQPDQPTYTEEVMIGPMGISGVKTTGQAPEFKGKSIPKVVGELGKTFAKGVVKFPADVLETAAIATAAARNLAAKTGIVDETSALNVSIPLGGTNINFFQAAGEWKDLVNDFAPTDKDIESGFWGQSASALGQMVPIILTGFASGGAKAIAKEAGKKALSMQTVANYGKGLVSRMGTSQGVVTISQVAAPSYQQAKLEGATENEALGFAIQNAVVSYPIEMLPVNNLFKRLDNVLVGNRGVEVLKRAIIGGSEEAVTEGVQRVYENVTADAIYGTTRSFLDGVGESTAVGGTVGAIMNGVLTALLGRRARATSTEEIQEIDKSIVDVEQKIDQVKSNNESIKETIKVIEETKPRVLSYGSANYNFIESPDGNLEYTDDALTEQQAQGVVSNLTNSYKKIDFKIEEVEPEDPYQPTTYRIIGTPKTPQQEAVVESGLTPTERIQQIETLELELKADDNIFKRGGDTLNYIERLTLEEELQTLKAEEDAFQKQAAGQVPVQPGARDSQEMAQGEPQAEPQVITEEGQAQEVITPEPAQEETFEQMMDRVRKEVGVIELEVKDFNSKNDREFTGRKDKYEIEDDIIKADNDVFYAQRNIGSADNVEDAINEYNKAKEKVSELKEEINQIDNFNRVDSLIFDEIQNSKKPDYEYNELFKQDPRIATIQSYNDSIDFLKTLEGKEESISRYERDIKILEEDIKKYPIKEQMSTAVAPEPVNINAAEMLSQFNKGDNINTSELERIQPPSDDIIKNVFDKFKNKFTSIKISGKRETEGAAFYDTVKKTIDINKNSSHWKEVNSESLISNLAHEYVHHAIDISENKAKIESDLENIKQDLINETPTFDNENDKYIFSFITAKNNSPQEVMTYIVSNPEIRKYFGKYSEKINEISQELFGIDFIEQQPITEDEKIQSKRTRDGRGRTKIRTIAPLEGAPAVRGINGPDPQLVAVAEKYAKENGIDLKRQSEYVEVDEDRAKRIADAYEQMAHDPKNPKVKEAYQDLIKQTVDQYQALVDAGYKFWFMDLNIPSNVEYASSPYNALRDMRENKEMGVFPTTDGFGTSDLDVEDNPLLAETGFMWPVGGLDGELKPVLANDLFRAVHDAFGHGLEGAGFRARGEENAWQAHVRLFTGPAIGAITSETRGQNSWLNYGPNGENNRTAKVEDTVFADQKTGLMPEWTWTEGRAGDMPTSELNIDDQVSLLEQLLAEEQAVPTAETGISISNDTDVQELRNKTQSRSQQARTKEDKDSANTRLKIINTAKRAINTLKSVYPGIDIIIHDDEGSYNAAMSVVNGVSGSRGNLFLETTPEGKTTGRIDINLSKADDRTVAHEVAHAILLKSFGDNSKLFSDFRTRISKIIKSDASKQLDDFANRYVDPNTGELLDVNHEEFLAELTGMLEQQQANLSLSTIQKIAALINEFVSKITGGKFKPFEDTKNTKDVVDFFNAISGAIREGQGVTEKINPNAEPTGTDVDTSSLKKRSSLIEKLGLERFNQMDDRITEGITLKNLGDVISHLTFSDRLVTGKVGNKDYLGGILFAAATNRVWASFTKIKVSQIINGMPRNEDGYRYLMPALLTEGSHMSNKDMSNTAIKLVEDAISKGDISPLDADSRVRKALNRKGLESFFKIYSDTIGKNKLTSKLVISAIDNAIIKSSSTFEDRKAFLESLLGKADIDLKRRFGTLPSYNVLANGLSEPITIGHDFGDILLTIRTKGDLVAAQPKQGDPDYHPSYPWVIRSVNPDGSIADVETLIFKQSYNAVNVFPEVTNKQGQKFTYQQYVDKYGDRAKSMYLGYIGARSTMATSVTEKVAGEAEPKSKVASRSQLPGDDIQRIVELGRANGLSDAAIEKFLSNKGLTKQAINEALGKEKKVTPPSVGKILGAPKRKKVTVDEMAALKDQIRLEARAAREAKGDLNRKRKALAAKIIAARRKGSINAAQARTLVNRISRVNLDNPIMVDRLIEYTDKVFDNANYAADMTELRKLQRQARTKKHTSMKDFVDRFTSINPELIPLDRIQDYKEALDFLNNRTPSYSRMNEMLPEIESYQVSEEFDAAKTMDGLMSKYESIRLNEVGSVEDYVNLIKEINSFKRKAFQLLQNEAVTQEQYDNLIDMVGKDQAAVEKRYEKEISKIKSDLISEIKKQRPKTNAKFSKEENDLIKEYLELSEDDLKSLSPENLFILNDLLDNINNGEIDYYRLKDIVSKAANNKAGVEVGKQLKASKLSLGSAELRNKMAQFESSFWEGLLGLGRATSGPLQKFIISPFNRAIGSYEKFIRDGFNDFLKLKKRYDIKDKDMNKIGMLTTYLQEYMAQFDPKNKGIDNIGKRDWFKQILDSETMRDDYSPEELKIIEEIHKSLPKDSKGNVDPKAVYNSYIANDGKFFTEDEEGFFDSIMQWKEDNSTSKQKAANEMSGNAFKEIPFHMLRSRYSGQNSQITPSTSGDNGMVRIKAGTGKERASEAVGAINTNFEKLFIKGLEQTGRDYFLSKTLKDINNVLSSAKKELDGDKDPLVKAISYTLSDALAYEFSDTASQNLLKRLVQARAAMTLFDPIRAGVEFTSTLLSFGLRARTLSGYKNLFGSQGEMKNLLEFTDSPLRLRQNINNAIDINDGRIEPQGMLMKWTTFLSGLPERTMMVTSWMPTFTNEFQSITGEKFDMKKFNDSEAYREKYGKAIKDASAVADAQTEKIIGPTTKAGQRREIIIFPGKTVGRDTVSGQILGFFSNYPYREVTEFVNGFREAGEVLKKSDTVDALSQLQKPLGIALNVAAYGFLSSVVYASRLILLGDDEEEKRGDKLLEELMTAKGFIEETAANAAALAASKYAGGGRAVLQVLGTLGMMMTDDEKTKDTIKKMLKGSVYVDPLPTQRLSGYGTADKVNTAIVKYIPQFVVLSNIIIDGLGGLNEMKAIYDKVEKKGVEALTEDEELKVLALSVMFTATQLFLNYQGTSLPSYNNLKAGMKAVKEEAGVADISAGKVPAKKKSSGGGGSSRGGGMNKTDMKKYNPELYDKMYGPGSAGYEVEEQVKAFEKEQREFKKKMKEQLYGGKD